LNYIIFLETFLIKQALPFEWQESHEVDILCTKMCR